MSIKYSIVNMVASSSLNQDLDLKEISEALKGMSGVEVRYEPEKFPGLIMKWWNKSVLLFRNGKLVIAGAKSKKELEETISFIMRVLTPILKTVPEKIRVEIQNMVVTGDLGGNIDLELLAEKRGAVYDPEQFPGLRLNLYSVSGGKSPCTSLIFSNGRFVLVGCRKEEDVEKSVKVLEDVISEPGIQW